MKAMTKIRSYVNIFVATTLLKIVLEKQSPQTISHKNLLVERYDTLIHVVDRKYMYFHKTYVHCNLSEIPAY